MKVGLKGPSLPLALAVIPGGQFFGSKERHAFFLRLQQPRAGPRTPPSQIPLRTCGMLADPGMTGILAGEVKARVKAAPEAIRMMMDRWNRLKEEVLNKDVPKRNEDQLGRLEVLPGAAWMLVDPKETGILAGKEATWMLVYLEVKELKIAPRANGMLTYLEAIIGGGPGGNLDAGGPGGD